MIVELISVVIAAIVGPILVQRYLNYQERKKKKDPLPEDIRINSLISSKLEEIKNIYNVDRIWLAQFHNGGVFYPTGRSIQKFSITYELIDPGMGSIMSQYQSIPISLFSKCLDHLQEGNRIEIPDTKVNDIFTSFSSMDGNSESVYVFPLLTIDNKFSGFVVLDYHNEVILNKELLSEVEIEVTSIAGVLTNVK